MHLNLHQEQYSGNRTPTEIGTHAAIYHSHSMLWNETTRSMTGNCWPSSRLWQNGTTTYLAPPPCHSFIGSQEPHLFSNSTEVEQMTSMLEPIPFGIWAQADTCSWNSDGTIRCTLLMTRPMSRWRLGQWKQDLTTQRPLYQRYWHWTQGPYYQQQTDWHTSNWCHMSTAEQGASANEIKDFWLDIWGWTHILQGTVLCPQRPGVTKKHTTTIPQLTTPGAPRTTMNPRDYTMWL